MSFFALCSFSLEAITPLMLGINQLSCNCTHAVHFHPFNFLGTISLEVGFAPSSFWASSLKQLRNIND